MGEGETACAGEQPNDPENSAYAGVLNHAARLMRHWTLTSQLDPRSLVTTKYDIAPPNSDFFTAGHPDPRHPCCCSAALVLV